jgi:hypothetical protein
MARFITEKVLLDWDKGVCIHRTHVGDGEGGMATGTGTEIRKSFEDFVEKSETRAVGRALAALGIGTQFVGEELSEGEHVANAPVTVNITTVYSDPLPAGENVAESPAAPPHPSAEQIDRLFEVATACREPKELLGRRLREVMGLSGETRITKKLLRESMTPPQYEVALAYYTNLLKRQVEEDVPDGTAPTEAPASEPAHASTSEGVREQFRTTHHPTPREPAEGSPAVPSPAASSSAPAPSRDDAAERDRVRLRQEVATWDLRVKPEEVEHVIQHNPYSKARALLWKCRRQDTAAD